VAPIVLEYVPEGHCSGIVEPFEEVYVPAGAFLQSLKEVPRTSRYLPIGHCEQDVDPATAKLPKGQDEQLVGFKAELPMYPALHLIEHSG